MKNIQKIGLFIIVSILITIFACRKQTNSNQSDRKMYLDKSAIAGVLSSPMSIEEQLRWMARGYAGAIEQFKPALFNQLTNHLDALPYKEDMHTPLELIVDNSLNISLEDEVYQQISVLPNSSIYDRTNFFGFTYNSCPWGVGLRIVDTLDLSLPQVVTYESQLGSDSVWGYFWQGGLDSVLLHSNNFEDYCILAVFADPDCNILAAYGAPNEPLCNGNGICEPLNNESWPGCPDCPPPPNPPNPIYALRVIWVRINEDKQRFDESWIQNKYELAWDFLIADNTTAKITFYRNDQDARVWNNWKRIEVPRQNKKKMKGSATQKENKFTPYCKIYDFFDPLVQDIYLKFWEDDMHGTKSFYNWYEDGTPLSPITASWPTSNAKDDKLEDDWAKERTKGGTFYTFNGTNPVQGVLTAPANSTWTPETIGGKACMVAEFTTPGLNEITVKLAYEL